MEMKADSKVRSRNFSFFNYNNVHIPLVIKFRIK